MTPKMTVLDDKVLLHFLGGEREGGKKYKKLAAISSLEFFIRAQKFLSFRAWRKSTRREVRSLAVFRLFLFENIILKIV